MKKEDQGALECGAMMLRENPNSTMRICAAVQMTGVWPAINASTALRDQCGVTDLHN